MVVVKVPTFTLLAIGLVFSFAFTWTCRTFWEATLGPAFRRLAGVGFGGVRGIGAVHPLGFLRAVDTSVVNWTTRGMQASERGIVYSINQVIDTAGLLFGIPLAIALALYELATWAKHEIGHAISRPEHAKDVGKIKDQAKGAASVTKVQFNHLTARVDALGARVAHFAHAIPATVATPFPRIGRIERDLTNVKARLKKAEKVLAVGASAALVLTALKRLGLGWVRCSNVTKTGKRLCGLDGGLLDALLIGTTLLVGTISLREFAEEVGSITEEASGLIHGFLRDA